MRAKVALSLPLLLSLAGCPTEPPPRVKEPTGPVDEWAGMQGSSEWLYATKGFSGPHKAECAHVAKVLEGEAKCRGALCEHARNLANDWRGRCKRLDADDVERVSSLATELGASAETKPDACATEAATLLRDGCKKGKDCVETAQVWATSCAHAVGSPLVVKMIERTVERSLAEPAEVTLDQRACDELRLEVVEGAKCDHEFKCQDAMKKLDSYRARCEGGGQAPPSIATAALELAILSGAKKTSPPILVTPDPAITPAEMGGALADGWGAVLWACDARVLELPKYLESRRGCQAGTVVAARAFKTKSGDTEVRLGTLELPTDEVLRARVPWLVVSGEAEAREKDAAAALEAELGKVLAAASQKGGEAEAAKALARAMATHAKNLRKSALVRAKLSAHAGELGPLLRELGKAKVAASRKVTAGDFLAFVRRSAKRPFADLGADGAVEIGAVSAGSELESVLALDSASAGYAEEIARLQKVAKLKKPTKRDVDKAHAAVTEQASACAAAEKKVKLGEKGIVACAFGFVTCDDAKVAEFGKEGDAARAAAETAWRKLEGAPLDDDSAAQAAAQAKQSDCVAPWW